ncbi:condensation domain-containing protein, partial [Fusobacterium necrophorum]|uniref:condensation domain-containing protein n=1 Tax=Fusobacterium necrophorum TaxID=859 RepID=UPI00373AE484
MSEVEQKERIRLERERMSHYIFDPTKWPLFEFKAFKVNCNYAIICISMDMLILDGSSLRIFVKEWMKEYEKEKLPLLDFNFGDYVLAYENFKESDTYKRDKEYWLSKVDSFPNSPTLPLKTSISEVKTPHFKRCQYFMKSEKWEKIKKLSQDRNITPSALLFSAYSKILAYWSNQDRIGLNVTVFTRYPFHKDVEKIIGDFTSVMLLDVEITEKGFWEDTRKIQENLL